MAICLLFVWIIGVFVFGGIMLAHEDVDMDKGMMMALFWPITIIGLFGYGIGILIKKIGI